ncbi:beta-galactosidase [Ruficoccus amylovorans]|uniref:Beta-galactosidase n=1 Tax=Ruficoccus amylovorans TaxID=1804625 RepID=A0A842HBW1_9BACT|nr:beta-galactosidase [Ruficoccus amylovorans]MBC2593902.1 beta-galactosidase [Ruficoccus amylovorans]
MKVSYDQRALLINGKRTLILSGSVHYPRSTPAMWRNILRHMRLSGLNTVETYVFWNLHERRRGVLDFSDRLDLVKFCQLAQQEGLHVILRIGPYICAETNYGGLPGWLRDIPGIMMRTDNEPFKREKERWVRLVAELIRPLCAPSGGPIILAQIENEYDNIASTYGEAGKRYLQWSVNLANSLRLDIPWVTCAAGRAAEAGRDGATASAGDALETLNAFRAHEIIEEHFAAHPNSPALWTENWVGWYHTWGGVLPRRDPAELAWATARFFAAGGTGVNYYLWHGGTNFERDGMYLATTSFEFGGCLDEYGLPSDKATHLARLNHALLACSSELLEGERPQKQTSPQGIITYCYASGLEFHCDDANKSLKIIGKDGETLYDSTQKLMTITPGWEKSVEPFSDWSWRPEPQPQDWPDAVQSASLSQQPQDQLSLTHDLTDYCWYQTQLMVNTDQASGTAKLHFTRMADIAYVFIDDQLAATTSGPLLERRGSLDAGKFSQTFTIDLQSLNISGGPHRLTVLCCALGLIKGDWMIGYANMSQEKKGLWGPVTWDGQPLDGPWRQQPALLGERANFAGASGALLAWQVPSNTPPPSNSPLWWRVAFKTPKDSGPWGLDLYGMGKGMAWINGHCLGRYWLLPNTDPMGPWMDWMKGSLQAKVEPDSVERFYHVPSEWLRPEGQSNSLVLFDETGASPHHARLLKRTTSCQLAPSVKSHSCSNQVVSSKHP